MQTSIMILVRSAGLPCRLLYPETVGERAWSFFEEQEHLESGISDRIQSALDELLAATPESENRTSIYNIRKDFFQKRKLPDKAVAVLSAYPGFPELIDTWKKTLAWREKLEEYYEEQLLNDLRNIQSAAGFENLQRALLFASHDLLDNLPAIGQKPPETWGKKEKQAARSVLQYLSRGIFKTSPFSRFTTVGRLKDETTDGPLFDATKPVVTPSVAILPGIYEVLLKDPLFYRSLSLRINPSLQLLEGDRLSWLYFDGEQESFQQMENSGIIELVLNLFQASSAVYSFGKLAEALLEQIDAPPEKMESFILEMVDYGLLEWILPEYGMSRSWASGLYQYLGPLSQSPLLVSTAFLLTCLRACARAMPFQTLEEARRSQLDAHALLRDFMASNDRPFALKPEQLFFEDVEREVAVNQNAIGILTGQLADCWRDCPPRPLPTMAAKLFDVAEFLLKPGESIDFQEFCKAFMTWDKEPKQRVSPIHSGKIGALMMPYMENGRYRAVVNAMYPGGGKLFSRWERFPVDGIPFPWQGWSNANFQADNAETGIWVPDGRVGVKARRCILLSDLAVRLADSGPVLTDKKSGERMVCNDLGLEAPELRPPVMQILWHLSVPFVSLGLLTGIPESRQLIHEAVFTPRMEWKDLVLRRARWIVPGQFWNSPHVSSDADRFYQTRKKLQALGVPRFIFVRQQEDRSKPQFIDTESPAFMQLLEKMQASYDGRWQIEEMLPTPDQWVAGASEKFAVELALEFDA